MKPISDNVASMMGALRPPTTFYEFAVGTYDKPVSPFGPFAVAMSASMPCLWRRQRGQDDPDWSKPVIVARFDPGTMPSADRIKGRLTAMVQAGETTWDEVQRAVAEAIAEGRRADDAP